MFLPSSTQKKAGEILASRTIFSENVTGSDGQQTITFYPNAYSKSYTV
jgi:hypothetical protein